LSAGKRLAQRYLNSRDENVVGTFKGKSQRDRARELIAVAHPDFQSDLAAEAKRLLS
jgi:hypothetical protein